MKRISLLISSIISLFGFYKKDEIRWVSDPNAYSKYYNCKNFTKIKILIFALFSLFGVAQAQTIPTPATWNNTQTFNSVKFLFGSDATGDLYYRGSDGLLKRLPLGSADQILGQSSGLPAWVTPAPSGAQRLTANSAFPTATAGAYKLYLSNQSGAIIDSVSLTAMGIQAGTESDLNAASIYTNAGVRGFRWTSTTTNSPLAASTGSGILVIRTAGSLVGAMMITNPNGTNNRIYYRLGLSTNAWGAWESVAKLSDVPTAYTITWPGAIFTSPTTATGTSTINFAPALATQTANRVFAGPTTGASAAPTFRALVAADLPTGTGTVTGVSSANTDIGVATGTSTPVLTFNRAGAFTWSGIHTFNNQLRGSSNLDGVSYSGQFNSSAFGNYLIGNNRSAAKGELNLVNFVGTGPFAIGGFNVSQVSTAGVETPLLDINGTTKYATFYGGGEFSGILQGTVLKSLAGIQTPGGNPIEYNFGTYSTNLFATNATQNNDVRLPNESGTLEVGRKLRLTGSGTGAATTISIPHGLTGISASSIAIVQPINAASAGISYVTTDATNINIVYTVAPASGTNNLQYNLSIKP